MISTTLNSGALNLLQQLIQTPSFSQDEGAAADLITGFLAKAGVPNHRHLNNVWAATPFDKGKQTLLLNSHLDTVRPHASYTRDPFDGQIDADRLWGLGSNDAGASLVALLFTFLHFYRIDKLPWNIVFAATAEEEISGPNGIEALLKIVPAPDFAIVGEPTEMQPAIAEKGLMVIDGIATGTGGHAAHPNADQAIGHAIRDIQALQQISLPDVSAWLGQVNIAVTQVSAGSQHNVIPSECRFVIDVRSTDRYANQSIFEYLQQRTKSKLRARSFRLQPSYTPADHPMVQAAVALGLQPYGSPTLSDQALLPCLSIKMGPGQSVRSHTANEFIYIRELTSGIKQYIALLNQFFAL